MHVAEGTAAVAIDCVKDPQYDELLSILTI